MDLGIKGKRALVCAASKGLGRGCAEALAAEGVDLIINARGEAALASTASEIAERYGVKVDHVATDITTEAGRAAVLDVAGEIDILVNNAGGPPPGHWQDWSRDDFIKAVDANMLTAIALMQATVPGMMSRNWGRVVNITSAAVRSPIGVLGLSNTARTGLTGFVAGMSRDVIKHGVNVNNLLPGLHATDRAVSLDGGAAKAEGITIDEARARRQSTIPAGRYGEAEDFGAACAFLCSEQAKFIVGQNILLDGGALNVTM
ncbi:MAG TPA: SDR family oxidoreductase [Paracoccus sp. (in: a-proteobacteria)]|uniref:SDR family oxidoreductase n=1 Tax=uncultured Paracoccus sp. TaxID=189685 RepID=UPI00260CBA33|nr:SDR family oxidoreductase [uncultured Paracoccus sp.]HMQ40649.1 SDR family oxidoreductase [Paracoccus sp. (in: a-proteobacteria)]HMR36261.1 SDR family oxidoreductase [Paracoccus sp. (in: a-proteobacteria)]